MDQFRDQLNRIERGVRENHQDHEARLRIVEGLVATNKIIETVTNDHEKRLRALEKILGYGLGAAVVVKILVETLHLKIP